MWDIGVAHGVTKVHRMKRPGRSFGLPKSIHQLWYYVILLLVWLQRCMKMLKQTWKLYQVLQSYTGICNIQSRSINFQLLWLYVLPYERTHIQRIDQKVGRLEYQNCHLQWWTNGRHKCRCRRGRILRVNSHSLARIPVDWVLLVPVTSSSPSL